MERLPYIDTHEQSLPLPPADAWSSLLDVLRRDLGGTPPTLVKLWGLEPTGRSGSHPFSAEPGDAFPGFGVESVQVPERLSLAGHHRFSRYRLTFELEAIGEDRTRLLAVSWAAFAGLHGHAYRAAVIGTRMHRLAVRRMLRHVEERCRENRRGAR